MLSKFDHVGETSEIQSYKQTYQKIEPIINTAGKKNMFGETLLVQTTRI